MSFSIFFVFKFIEQYCSQNAYDMEVTMNTLSEGDTGLHAIKRYCRKYDGNCAIYFLFDPYFECFLSKFLFECC